MNKTAYYFYINGNSHKIAFVIQCLGPCSPYYQNNLRKEGRELCFFWGDVHTYIFIFSILRVRETLLCNLTILLWMSRDQARTEKFIKICLLYT